LGNVGGNKNRQGGGTIFVGNVAEKLWGASDLPAFVWGWPLCRPTQNKGKDEVHPELLCGATKKPP
jgi:hypothetical protein